MWRIVSRCQYWIALGEFLWCKRLLAYTWINGSSMPSRISKSPRAFQWSTFTAILEKFRKKLFVNGKFSLGSCKFQVLLSLQPSLCTTTLKRAAASFRLQSRRSFSDTHRLVRNAGRTRIACSEFRLRPLLLDHWATMLLVRSPRLWCTGGYWKLLRHCPLEWHISIGPVWYDWKTSLCLLEWILFQLKTLQSLNTLLCCEDGATVKTDESSTLLASSH